MALKLMYITNDTQIAKIAQDSGVDWIFVDLEINGKEERQGHLDTVISRHRIADVSKIKQVLSKSELLVRVNPIYEGSKEEIEKVVNDGADIVMLPFFKTKEEVEIFTRYVGGRAKTCLLLETPEAVENLDLILEVENIDYIHIGLNDLHLGYGMKFMFELLADGTVEKLCERIKKHNIPYGFGGIAQVGEGMLPAENIMTEHHRLGSQMVILSRSFLNTKKQTNAEAIKKEFVNGINKIRNYEIYLEDQDEDFFIRNKGKINLIIQKIVN